MFFYTFTITCRVHSRNLTLYKSSAANLISIRTSGRCDHLVKTVQIGNNSMVSVYMTYIANIVIVIITVITLFRKNVIYLYILKYYLE